MRKHSDETRIATQMDITKIQVVTQNRGRFTLTDDTPKAISVFEKDGWVLLKNVSDLTVAEPAIIRYYLEKGEKKCRAERGLLKNKLILECIHGDITLNRVNCCLSTLK